MTASNHLDQATHGSSRTTSHRYKGAVGVRGAQITASNYPDQATHGSSRTTSRRYEGAAK